MNYRVFLVVFMCFVALSGAQQKKMLLIETQHDPLYNYHGLQVLADHAGFMSTCVNFTAIPEDLSAYDAVFLLMSGYFFNKAFDSDLYKTVLNRLQNYTKISNRKIIGLIFPHETIFNNAMLDQTKRILAQFQLYPYSYTECLKSYVQKIWSNKQIESDCLVQAFINYVLQPSYLRSANYATALFYKGSKHKEEELPLTLFSNNKPNAVTYLMPKALNTQFTPMGLALEKDTTLFFISKMSWIDVFEINENFKVNPIDRKKRSELIMSVQTSLQELHTFLSGDPASSTINIPSTFSEKTSEQKKEAFQRKRREHMHQRYHWLDKSKINAAWLELEPYIQNQTVLQQGMSSILDAHLNLLWMSLSPERFFSPRVVGKDEQTKSFLQGLTSFTKELKQASKKRKVTPPAFFVGCEITGNFGKQPVQYAVADMTGKKLDKIPAPFDWDTFWEQELIHPLTMFVQQWKAGVGSGLPLTGVFLDLEMYHAQQQASEYTNMMDFGDHTWQLYAQQYPEELKKTLTTVQQRISFLKKHEKFLEYYEFLQSEARKIGIRIRNSIRNILPDAMIGVYSMTLPHSWFLLGILSGLSTPTDPIILATFNNDAYRHFDYLQKQSIYCFHIPVMLLSKFRSPKDFSLIQQVRKYHDGIWYNRFSRLVETLNDKVWWQLEASPLDKQMVSQKIGEHALP